MKHIILTLVASSLCILGQAQKLSPSDVPQAVADAFSKKFPMAKNVKWEKENPAEFEAEFKQDKAEVSACFSANGNCLLTETGIKKSELPKAVLATISKDFAGYEIEEAEKVETDRGMIYEVELEKDKVSYDVEFSSDGKVLKQEEDKHDEEEDDDDN